MPSSGAPSARLTSSSKNRIKLFVALPIEKLDRLAIQRGVDEIGGRGVVATIATPRLEV